MKKNTPRFIDKNLFLSRKKFPDSRICGFCKEIFVSRDDLLEHLKLIHGQQENSGTKDEEHGIDTNTNTTWECPLCKDIFPINNCDDHLKNIHPVENALLIQLEKNMKPKSIKPIFLRGGSPGGGRRR